MESLRYNFPSWKENPQYEVLMMINEVEQLNMDNAQAALDSVEKMVSAGLQRGLYPRWFAAATAVWAGVLAALIAIESSLWIVLFVGGLIGYSLYRRRRGAWVQEVHSWREFWLVIIPGSISVCIVATCGIVGWQHFGLPWAPIAAGITITMGLFTLMEVTYRAARIRFRMENES